MNCIKHLYASEHRVVVVSVSVLAVYFLIMDSALYRCIQSRSPSSTTPFSTANAETEPPYSPFNGLTVKLMMLNHANHYIFLPLAAIFNQVLHFSDTFYFITANMISALGVVCGVVSGYMVSSSSLTTRQWSVLVYQLRTFMDALDGVVVRARIRNHTNISGWGTMGHYVDGAADTIGAIAFIVGVVLHLQKRYSVTKLGYSGLPIWKKQQSSSDTSTTYKSPQGVASPAVVNKGIRSLPCVVLAFGTFLAVSSIFWDNYISRYYKLLETLPVPDLHSAELQSEVLKSMMMWSIVWLWRFCNSFFFMDLLMVSVLVDKVWEFLTWIQFVGLAMLVLLVVVTEIHYQVTRNYLETAGLRALTGVI